MRIYIHPDLSLNREVLTDAKLGVRYSLTSDTAWLLRQLMYECRAERIILSAARQKGISSHEARQSLYNLLGYLNTIGGVYVVHDSLLYVNGWLNRLSWRHRYAPDGIGFWRAMSRSYGLLCALLSLLFIGLCTIKPHVPLLMTMLPAAVLASCVLHEAGHFLAVQASGKTSILLSSFGYAAIVHARPSRHWAQCIAAAGPVMTTVVYAAAAWCIGPLPLKCIAAMIALVHAAALLPWFADGKTLWRNI